MAENTVFAMILSEGGRILKSYENVGAARKDLKDMMNNKKAVNAYVFKKFLFKVEKESSVVFSKEFE